MSDGSRVLIVDDDASVCAMLSEYLLDHDYEVRCAGSGKAMRDEIERELPDAILLDIHLPGEDGISLARFLRERYDVAIIMVTGASDVIDRVVGLEVGADDYVAKPFDPRELLARLRSVLRRMQARTQPETAGSAPPSPALPAAPAADPRVRVGGCWLEVQSRRLINDAGDDVPITAMEFDLLRAFIANPNRVLSRDQLLMHARNREWQPFDRSIDIRIGRLRRKIELDAGEPRTIRTVRNGGYMFVPDGSA
jgi:two-component system phosphate regulon response regulator OmpR